MADAFRVPDSWRLSIDTLLIATMPGPDETVLAKSSPLKDGRPIGDY
jgi:hypothetical protein